MNNDQGNISVPLTARPALATVSALALILAFATPVIDASAATGDAPASTADDLIDDVAAENAASSDACSKTARVVRWGCHADTTDEYWSAIGNCINISDTGERLTCREDARADRHEARRLCNTQHDARVDACTLVGRDRYEPSFDASDFVDTADIGHGVAANQYLPLVGGTRWVYRGGDETTTVTVTGNTKLIDGVTCRVVTDVVESDEGAVEITEDWIAQDRRGNIWYCGESVRNFENFRGDAHQEPELVDIDGNFKVGRDAALPGILMLATPRVGKGYREEFALGEAEDLAGC
jgi:hypothetical protein